MKIRQAIFDQIVAHGRVIRGWLGAEYADVSVLQNPSASHGVAIVGIYDKGPAALAGLKPGDVLFTLDGKPITSQLELRNHEASLAPGTQVHLTGERYGSPFSPDSMNNQFGAGSPFKPDSPNNPYGTGWRIEGR